MSATEVVARGRQQLVRLTWRCGATPRPGRTVVGGRFIAGLPPCDTRAVDANAVKAVIARADSILAGSLEILGVARDDLTQPDWFLDPITGRRAPQEALAFGIPVRDEARVGTIKQLWELSRHQHLTTLAAAYWISGDEAFARRVGEHLRSWWSENPFLMGVHWTSGIELGLRLISWVWVRRLLDAWPGVAELFELNPVFLRQLGDHQRYLATFVSVGSSANNHVIAEAAGQLVAATAFPWFPASAQWARRARQLLERELAAQTFPSGLNRELATDYHGFVLELALAAAAEIALHDEDVPSSLAELIVRMVDALATIVDLDLHPPRQGDGDDGMGLVIDPPGPGRWGSLLATGRRLFGALDWWPEESAADVRAVLLAQALAGRFPAVGGRPKVRRALLPDAGMVVIRATDAGEELWCRGDVGPHGFKSIAAHAHADALSIELRVDGVEVIADPGTFCYHGEAPWRRYFRGTSAHSTLELDGRDQSISGGPFLWTKHATTRLLESSGLAHGPVARWIAEHDGYSLSRLPLVHRRTLELHRDVARVVVIDELIGTGRHPARLMFPLGPLVRCELAGALAHLSWGDRPRRAHVVLDPKLTWQVHRGDEDPPLGWYSPSFGRRVAAATLVGEGELAGGDVLHCELRLCTGHES
jgi:hypothetical protein